MPEIVFSEIKSQFENINIVLSQIVPGLNVDLHELSPALMKDGSMGHVVEIVSSRNETDMSVFHNQEAAPDGRVHMPFRYESDGIRKIVSVLSLIIDAYNEQSCTIAIDELDAGVFEYLLGEVLHSQEGTVLSRIQSPTDGILFFAHGASLVSESQVLFKIIRRLHL